jgi:hypothetical protein
MVSGSARGAASDGGGWVDLCEKAIDVYVSTCLFVYDVLEASTKLTGRSKKITNALKMAESYRRGMRGYECMCLRCRRLK